VPSTTVVEPHGTVRRGCTNHRILGLSCERLEEWALFVGAMRAVASACTCWESRRWRVLVPVCVFFFGFNVLQRSLVANPVYISWLAMLLTVLMTFLFKELYNRNCLSPYARIERTHDESSGRRWYPFERGVRAGFLCVLNIEA
jgi:hypothetical protein